MSATYGYTDTRRASRTGSKLGGRSDVGLLICIGWPLARVDEETKLRQRKQWKGRPVRALRPFAEDQALLSAISRGEFVLQGIRNRGRQGLLFEAVASNEKERR